MTSDRALSPEERITCAYLNVVRKVAIMDLAVAFAVNMGRVSEAVTAIRKVAEERQLKVISDD